MSVPHASSQRVLVERALDWARVESRLSQFPAIAGEFPLEALRSRKELGPYFCHYMAWRLGTWNDDALVARIDELLQYGRSLPNWQYERQRLGSGDFGAFWSLVWQLQVAEFLGVRGSQVEWLKSGPDLSVVVAGQQLFVECYVYHKAFDVELYVEELLLATGADLRVRRDSHLKFAMPQGAALTDELSRMLAPLLDEAGLAEARRQAATRYPVVLAQSADRRLSIFVEGESASAFDPAALQSNSGDPESTLAVALEETVNAKRRSNALGSHRPNLLMVNYLLSSDVQCARSYAAATAAPTSVSLIDSDVEAIAYVTTGIDRRLRASDIVLAASKQSDHPFHVLAGAA